MVTGLSVTCGSPPRTRRDFSPFTSNVNAEPSHLAMTRYHTPACTGRLI